MNLLHFYDIRRLYLPRTSYKCVYKSFYDNLQCPSKVMCSINDNDNNNFLIMKKKYLEMQGIDPRTSHMLSERSTI